MEKEQAKDVALTEERLENIVAGLTDQEKEKILEQYHFLVDVSLKERTDQVKSIVCMMPFFPYLEIDDSTFDEPKK